jgi:hypothetical protein
VQDFSEHCNAVSGSIKAGNLDHLSNYQLSEAGYNEVLNNITAGLCLRFISIE